MKSRCEIVEEYYDIAVERTKLAIMEDPALSVEEIQWGCHGGWLASGKDRLCHHPRRLEGGNGKKITTTVVSKFLRGFNMVLTQMLIRLLVEQDPPPAGQGPKFRIGMQCS
jgi:hypothetical protein